MFLEEPFSMSTVPTPTSGAEPPDPGPDLGPHVLERIFLGPQGLRAGWSVLLGYGLFYLFRMVIGTVYLAAHLVSENSSFEAVSALALESIPLLAMLGAGTIMAMVERRRLVDYNLSGPQRVRHFWGGLLAGFVGLSVLIGALRLGGWLQFGPVGLSGASILRFAALWGCAFLVIGFVEEGLFRCYLQFTLTRGLNFWWALAAEAALCLYLRVQPQNRGTWGVYAVALLGLFPCLILHQKAAACSAFWQAAWVTSTFFAMIHTFNGGENWIGIFAAGSIGLVFCASVRTTGSAWWAIGCHSAWDWTETYFYGTADSGLPARGHLLSSSPVGNPLFSGGADGPEGSVLVFGAILFLFLLVFVTNARRKPAEHV
jgi:membrane protease YdiL (CAAX protease family)